MSILFASSLSPYGFRLSIDYPESVYLSHNKLVIS